MPFSNQNLIESVPEARVTSAPVYLVGRRPLPSNCRQTSLSLALLLRIAHARPPPPQQLPPTANRAHLAAAFAAFAAAGQPASSAPPAVFCDPNISVADFVRLKGPTERVSSYDRKKEGGREGGKDGGKKAIAAAASGGAS